MAAPAPAGRHGRGVLLLRGDREPVEAWLSRGQVATRLLTVPGWTLVVPAEDSARSAPPYDDPFSMLAARPVPAKLRTALGLFAVGGRAVLTVQAAGWRTVHRWLVWEPGTGIARTDLTLARPQDLVDGAGVGDRVSAGEVSRVLRDTTGDAAGMLENVIRVLDLPVEGLLDDREALSRATVVEPQDVAVRRFDRTAAEELADRSEQDRRHGREGS